MFTEPISADPCGVVRRWNLDTTLASMLLDLDFWACRQIEKEVERSPLPSRRFRWPGLWIKSGHRSQPVVSAFHPTAPAATKSRHLFKPSLAADLRVGNVAASETPIEIWTFLGLQWERQGGRWGGRFSLPDPNHFDIDPFLTRRGLEVPTGRLLNGR